MGKATTPHALKRPLPAAINGSRRAVRHNGPREAPPRDAIGALALPSHRPAMPYSPSAGGGAVTVAIPSPIPLTESGGAGGVTVNAAATKAVPVHAPLSNPALNSAAINGTATGRVVFSRAAIGGPAKDRTAINGTTIRPKVH
jgi:hypothetical protein